MPRPAPDPDAARARFAAATAAHLTAPLADGVTLRHVEPDEHDAAMDGLWNADPRPGGELHAVISEPEQARAADLNAILSPPLDHRIVIEQDGELIGTYWGMQEQLGRYYMVNSIVRGDRRGRGLYSALLSRVVAMATEAGFQQIYSRNRATNNEVLVPELRAGFVIAGFDVAPRFGLLVHLRKYLHPGVARAFEHRIDGAYGDELRAAGFIR